MLAFDRAQYAKAKPVDEPELSAKAAEPYYGRLLAYYLLIIFSWILTPILIGLFIPLAVAIDTIRV